jgi:hypothetical protein
MYLNQRNRNMVILGTALLIIVAFILLVSPSLFLSPTVTFIDTELSKASENRMPVQTKTDFGNREVMASFPRQIGKWEGSDYDVNKYIELLGANLILLRGYMPSTFTQPLFFTIVQSRSASSFHPPKVCFSAQGYEIQEEGDETVAISDASWLQNPSTASVPLKKLVVTKSGRDGKLTERRVALFCYVKGNQFYSDTITMIQTEALAPLQGSYEGSLGEQKAFLAQAVPLMFSPSQADSQWHPLALSLTERGPVGFAVLALLFIIPVGIIAYPALRLGGSIKKGNK